MQLPNLFRFRAPVLALLVVVTGLILLASLAIPHDVYSKADQKIECGLPFRFLRLDLTRYDPPLPWSYNCLQFNPMENQVSLSPQHFLASFLSIFLVLAVVVRLVVPKSQPGNPTGRWQSMKTHGPAVVGLLLIGAGAIIFIATALTARKIDNQSMSAQEAATLARRAMPDLANWPDPTARAARKPNLVGGSLDGWALTFRRFTTPGQSPAERCYSIWFVNDAPAVTTESCTPST